MQTAATNPSAMFEHTRVDTMQSRVSAPPRKPRPLKSPNQYSFLIVQSDPQDQKHGKGSPHWLVDIVVRESWVSRVPNTPEELKPNLQTASGAVAVDMIHSPSIIGGATEAFGTKMRTISKEVGGYDAHGNCKKNALRILQALKDEGHIMSTVTIALIEEAMRDSVADTAAHGRAAPLNTPQIYSLYEFE